MRKKENPRAGNTGGNEHERGFTPSQQFEKIRIYPRGVKTEGGTGRVGLPPGAGGKRGIIKGWSAESRRRLREFLLTHEPDSDIYAVTLTVPGNVITPEQWRMLFNSFMSFLKLSGVGAVWRLELQKRGQPHLHMIATAPSKRGALNLAGYSVSFPVVGLYESILLWFSRCWMAFLDHCLPSCEGRIKTSDCGFDFGSSIPRSALMGADRHAVSVEADKGNSLWWRYLCDHTSKSKQEQICGWDGFRHWGVIGRKRFREVEPETLRISRSIFVRVYRWLRAASRRRVRDDRCVFGSRLVASPRRHFGGRAVWFGISPEIVTRLVGLASSLD